MATKSSAYAKETRQKNLYFFSVIFPLLTTLWLTLSFFHFAMDGKSFLDLPPNLRENYILSLFFRHDTWHIPLSLTTKLATPIPLSLTDSIPLMALLAKFFKINTFQYFGIWYLISYSLYVFFAYRICKDVFEKKHFHNLIAILIFISMPFIWYHPFHVPWLAGQWVILWAYSVYFKRKNFFTTEWSIILLAATLIHPLLAFVTFLIMLADIIHLYIYNHKISSVQAATSFSYQFTTVFLALTLVGVFYTPSILDLTHNIAPLMLKFNYSPTSNYNISYLNVGTGVFVGFISSVLLSFFLFKKTL